MGFPSACFTTKAVGTRCAIAACIAADRWAPAPLEGDTLVCPWHGFQYNITTGECLADPSARLDMYPVSVQDGQIHLQIPDLDAHLGEAPLRRQRLRRLRRGR